MSWGKELWDQSDGVAVQTQKGVEFLEKFGSFLRDRCAVETEYAKQLRSLAKKYQPKKKEEEDFSFSYGRAFLGVLQELQDVAGQHEVVAENFKDQVLSDVGTLSRDLKEQRKQHLTEAARLQQCLDSSVELMGKAKKEYARAFKEAEAAQAKFEKAEADMNLSRAEVEKAKNNAISKGQQAEDAKNTYALQLQKTNELQSQHYHQLLPAVFERLRQMEESRIVHLQRLIRQCVQIEKKVLPIVEKCLEGMLENADRVDAKSDCQMVVERYRTGYLPPEDYPFEEIHAEGSSGIVGLSANGVNSPQSIARGSTVTRSKGRSSKGFGRLFGSKQEDYADLPPSQRCNRLRLRIGQIEHEVQQKLAARDGLLKMQDVYEKQPKMGDLSQVQVQLSKNTEELERLNTELVKFKRFMEEANSQLNVPISRAAKRNSGSEDSLSRSNSETSVHKQPGSSNGSSGSSASPESGIDTGRISYADSDPYDQAAEAGETGYYNESDETSVLGTCRALYNFDGCSDGTIAMKENEQMLIVEKDEGDGWTRVRKIGTGQEGFVPTSYLECRLDP